MILQYCGDIKRLNKTYSRTFWIVWMACPVHLPAQPSGSLQMTVWPSVGCWYHAEEERHMWSKGSYPKVGRPPNRGALWSHSFPPRCEPQVCTQIHDRLVMQGSKQPKVDTWAVSLVMAITIAWSRLWCGQAEGKCHMQGDHILYDSIKRNVPKRQIYTER